MVALTAKRIELGPQPGPQEMFLSTPADIAIYGGAAFGGKTWALLYEGLRHIQNPGFGFVIFRRTTPQIRNEGGLWDESAKMYPLVGGSPRESVLEWKFASGARGKFAHLEQEANKYDWQGSQIPYLGFDELTHFSWGQFTYLLSRNRSLCGVPAYVRGTCNPDPDSFVARLIAWWIDQVTGYPIPERSGRVRYFLVEEDEIFWGGSRGELTQKFPDRDPENDIKSFTFIAAKMEDNPIGMKLDPAYRGNLLALPRVDRERLLGGNWQIRPSAGKYFQRSYFAVVDAVPAGTQAVRAWDLAGSEVKPGEDPDWTTGVKMERDPQGRYCVTHVERFRGTPLEVERRITNTASSDGTRVVIRIPQDPGQAGKDQAQRYVRLLAGYTVRIKPVTGDKVTRAGGYSAQAEAGNISLKRAPWNEAYLAEHEQFPDGRFDDQVDAGSDAFEELTQRRTIEEQKLSGV